MYHTISSQLEDAFSHYNITPSFFHSLYEQSPTELVSKVIQNNFSTVLSKCNSFMIVPVLEELSLHDNMYSFILDNTFLLLSNLGHNFYYLPEKFQRKKYINEHFMEIIKKYPRESVFTLASLPSFVDYSHKPELDSFLETNKEEYIFYLLGKQLSYIYTKEQLKELFSVISLLTDDILNEEGLSYTDIKRLPQGAYSDVIEIGSKVIKVGGKRFCYHVPNCPYLLQPLIRVNLEDISSIRGTIEVEEKVDMDLNISTSEVYSLYEKLRQYGIIWLDAKGSNIGRLLKDNNLYYHQQLALSMESRGLHGSNDYVLSKGECVVVDLDHLFLEDEVYQDPDLYHIFRTSNSYYYETLYQEHLKYASSKVVKEKMIRH